MNVQVQKNLIFCFMEVASTDFNCSDCSGHVRARTGREVVCGSPGSSDKLLAKGGLFCVSWPEGKLTCPAALLEQLRLNIVQRLWQLGKTSPEERKDFFARLLAVLERAPLAADALAEQMI